jgi:PAS domain S-box-containing protein
MRDSPKTRKQLIKELQETMQQLNALASSEVKRRHAEAELRESEDKFFKVFQSSPDMVIITNIKDGTYTDVNESFVRLTGYSREEIIGHTAEEPKIWVKQEDQERMVRLLQKHGKMRNEEFSFRTKSGEIRHWLCSAERISIGGEAHMLAVAADITEQKQAQEALRESEEKFSKAFRSSPQAIAITTLEDGRFIEVNDSFTRISGYTRKEAIGRSSIELALWVKPEERVQMIEELRKHGRVNNKEFNFRIKSGEIRSWLFSAELIDIGNEPCIIYVTTDITEQKQTQEALRESEKKFSKAFHSSPQAIAISTLEDGRFIEVNDSHARLTGYSREELIGHTSVELNIWLSPEDRDKMILKLIEKGRLYNEEFKGRNKSGLIQTVLFSSEFINIGGKRCILATTTDVTELRQTMEKARDAENLRALDRLRSELLANISHELRTPLASIKGFGTMLMDYDKKLTRQEKREYLETIDKNTDRLVELIEQLLEMSRLGAAMLSIKKTPTSIIKLCQEAITEARVRSPVHQFSLQMPYRLPRLDVDGRRIRQVLDNIIDNAVKYSDSGTDVTLSVQRSGPELLFTVTDHGMGISPKDLPHVFERLFGSAHRRKSGVDGTGLGLAISKGLVEAHAGKIWIESEEGMGTRCHFTLPFKK